MIRLTTHDGQSLELAPDARLTLAQHIFLAGLWDGVPLCAGLGKCGLCRVRFATAAPEPAAEELKRLGQAAIDQGWRLSCLHPATACDIELPEPKRSAQPRSSGATAQPGQHADGLCLAVDLGTTSIHWAVSAASAQDAPPGAQPDTTVLSSGQGLNPQMGLGSEVMSRLSFAARPGGEEILSSLCQERLRALVREAETRHGAKVTRLCVAGNSAMTYLLLGLPLDGLSRAPYRLDDAGGDDRDIAPDLPQTRIPPLLSPFVGADLSAGLAALTFAPREAGPPRYPFLLADLGTNGEFVLALSPTEHLLASVPMGPALEGVGLRHGRTAAPGAVRAFALTPAGLKPEYIERPPLTGVDGKTEDPGITGVGYLSLVAALRRAGVLDDSGRFVVPATPLGKRIASGLGLVQGEPVLDLGSGLALPATDVEELVKVKAAFNLALSRLLAESGLAAGALTAVYLAGAMGEHVDARDLATLGFLPEVLTARLVRAGNTSLEGAGLLLHSAEAWAWVRALPASCRALDLASDPRFGALFVERMVLRHVA
ncbi:ASKHA domain-containing protein [Humidesulfovibrio idahonensis]